MTTVDSENVYALRITGSFDDCQDIVKQAFNEKTFLNKDQYLLAVNSINWIRIVGQICYYFYASLKINNAPSPHVFNSTFLLIAFQTRPLLEPLSWYV